MKFRHTNFMRLIYATLLALPFVAILSRVIYVQSNKNAYQSYEAQTHYKDNFVKINNANQIYEGLQYHIVYNEEYESNYSPYFYYIDTSLDITTFNRYDPLITYVKMQITSANRIFFYNEEETSFCYNEDWGTTITDIVFTSTGRVTNSSFINQGKTQVLFITIEKDTLDNVFEYSVNKFIENNNFGKINLFQWTTDLFFDNNNVNNMYVGFINWYLNYTLLVSATYILFLVLMWFINYARRLLERGMNYDW